ncbi:MAG: Phenylacetic acid catabolic protein [Longimicrobiales bacterium]
MSDATAAVRESARASDLPDAQRESVRDLILDLADTKRVLGMRYADWLLGAPELEAGIALASMAQDEWGHARLLYSLLKEFDADVDAIEHGRQPEQYRSMQALDRAPESWPELVALNTFVDGALSLQLEALTSSAYLPLRQRVQKILDEEQFHAAHGRAWFLRLVRGGDETRNGIAAATHRYIPLILSWFGPDSDSARVLHDLSIVDAVGNELRMRYLQRFASLFAEIGDANFVLDIEPDWSQYDEAARRSTDTAPDAETIAKIRGDKNRAFLMD